MVKVTKNCLNKTSTKDIANLPKFLIVNFAQGAAGNFLSSILQCSNNIAHFSKIDHTSKPNTNWLLYFNKIFTKNYSTWLDLEPGSQFNTWGTRQIFSQTYPRGNNLSIEEFLKLEKENCSKYYFECKEQGLFIPIFWHKKEMPEYFANSIRLIINIDNESRRWYSHSFYKKHFSILESNNQHIKIADLSHRPNFSIYNFENEYILTYKNFRSFVKDKIINANQRKDFLNLKNIYEWDIDSYKINLSDILDLQSFIVRYQSICNHFNFDQIDTNTVQELHNYWINCH